MIVPRPPSLFVEQVAGVRFTTKVACTGNVPSGSSSDHVHAVTHALLSRYNRDCEEQSHKFSPVQRCLYKVHSRMSADLVGEWNDCRFLETQLLSVANVYIS